MSSTLAMVGSGYMGGGIAQVYALAGNRVALTDATPELAHSNYERLLRESDAFVAADLFPPDATERLRANLWPADTIEEAVDGATYITEAVPERIELKHETLARISAAAAPDAIIASNTSTILIGKMAPAVERPERFLGVHFSNPAPFIPGVEIITHAGTDEAIVPVVEELVRSTGKQTARINDATGFVLNRLQYALFAEANRLLEDGVASVETIDTVIRTTLGFRLPFFGPFAIADMAGLDVYEFCYRSLQTEWPERFATPKTLAELVADGHLGTKSGGGYLDVPADRVPELVAYRNNAYVRMQQLIDELGPAPLT